ncbi:hypothetical protein DVH24_008638 [Malus domestica]|uniref:Secreted protein n=1 Tax=Malus domestica TaxID=3750 RepID=A0A498JK78_MALDO|nr:hypothetical protein DVH24_008638 [Malus domestica]
MLAVSCILVALICILLLICSSCRPLPRLHVTDLLREFSKDSIRLVKRCHKPDRKGNSAFGILQGRAPDSDRVRRDGFRRVLRQADLHPHQQYHRWICLGIYWI